MKRAFVLILLGMASSLWNRGRGGNEKPATLVNLSHLNHLYETVTLADGRRAAIIHIYAEYPDYKPVEAKGEGFTCVDDIARAAVLYLRYGRYFNDAEALGRGRALIRTVLSMQADNGCFYNFIRSDGNIEKENRNSQPLPDWWTWRAFWALSEFGLHHTMQDSALADSVRRAIEKILPCVSTLKQRAGRWETIAGFQIPTWLPQKYGADQASILLKALANTFKWTGDTALLSLMRLPVKGILAMQVKDASASVNGLFLSWKNFWHAYGNSQSDALLDYFSITRDSVALQAALREIDNFYAYLTKVHYLHALTLHRENGHVSVEQRVQFEQIAYDIRPMIWACLNAFRQTGLKKYARMAGKIGSWFAGDNAGHFRMYDPNTGRCFDGILNSQKINLNSGAESTVEALLSLLEIEKNPTAAKFVNNAFKKGTQ